MQVLPLVAVHCELAVGLFNIGVVAGGQTKQLLIGLVPLSHLCDCLILGSCGGQVLQNC